MNRVSEKTYALLICVLLALVTFFSYLQVLHNDFVTFDDPGYVTKNDHVKAGLTSESVAWAFRFTGISYWHPLTWLSHMLDCHLYGVRPGMHHLTNLIIHILSTLLLFLVLKRATGAMLRSAFVAALFALHPLNVDSVAWLAERKNVLSTLFWMLTMLTYVHYVQRPGLRRYLLVFLTFVMGLLAKPMLVTLPFALLLLDYWPLARFSFGRSRNTAGTKTGKSARPGSQGSVVFRLILEKIPFLVLSIISVGLSSQSVQRYGQVVSTDLVPMKLRIANALVSYVAYIAKMLWPQNLSVLYPYPDAIPIWQTVGAALLLLCISTLVIWRLKSKPYLAIGWLWYLGTLVPVIGLMQTGLWPAMADRWAYVPLIGIFIIIAWGLPDMLAKWRYGKVAVASLALAVLLALTICTCFQLRHWRNSVTLYQHALEINERNPTMLNNLAWVLATAEDANVSNPPQAVEYARRACELTRYEKPSTLDTLAAAYAAAGRFPEAIVTAEKALYWARQQPQLADEIRNHMLFYKAGQPYTEP